MTKAGGSLSHKRRNMIARDLYTPKYGPRIRDTNRRHMIDELKEQEAEDEADRYLHGEYDYHKDLGLAGKE